MKGKTGDIRGGKSVWKSGHKIRYMTESADAMFTDHVGMAPEEFIDIMRKSIQFY